jgi:hypothetical protein
MQDLGVIDPQHGGKEFFHRQVKVVREARVVNNTCIIDVGKTYLDDSAIGHKIVSPFNLMQCQKQSQSIVELIGKADPFVKTAFRDI